MKRLLSLFLIILIVVSTMSGCGNKYEKTVDALSKIEINSEDPGHLLSEDLVKALKNAEYTKPKNVIFMIGDGMG